MSEMEQQCNSTNRLSVQYIFYGVLFHKSKYELMNTIFKLKFLPIFFSYNRISGRL
jgi:hypothetical protein